MRHPRVAFIVTGIKNDKWFSKNNPYGSFKQSIRRFLYVFVQNSRMHFYLSHSWNPYEKKKKEKRKSYEASKQSEIKIKCCSRFLDLSPIKISFQRFINKHCIEIFKRLQLYNKPKSYDNLNLFRSIIKYK